MNLMPNLTSFTVPILVLCTVASVVTACSPKSASKAPTNQSAAGAHQEPLRDFQAEGRHNADAALNIYIERAKQGDQKARLVLGEAYCEKYNLPDDLSKLNLNFYRNDIPSLSLCEGQGLPLLTELARRGNSDAQFALASIYNSTLRSGNESWMPAPDDGMALKWYLTLADKPNALKLEPGHNPFLDLPPEISSSAWAARFYESGRGAEKNLEKAFEYYQRAANEGYDQAIIEVARMQGKGLGTQQSLESAVAWLTKLPNDDQAEYRLAELYMFEGKSLPNSGTKALILLNNLNQSDTTPMLTRRGAYYYLGLLNYFGIGTDKDYKQAALYLTEAARQGEPHAQYMLATLYRQGLGALQDNQQAYVWAALSAANGDERGPQLRDELARQLSPGELEQARKSASQWGTGKRTAIYNCSTPKLGAESFKIDLDSYVATMTSTGGLTVSFDGLQAVDSVDGLKIYSNSPQSAGMGPFDIDTKTGQYESRQTFRKDSDVGACKRG